MISHVWSVLCSQTVTDAETNNVSLFNVIEQIAVTVKEDPKREPAFLRLPMEIVTLWERSEHDQAAKGQATVDVMDGAGSHLGGMEMMVDLSTANRCRSRLVLKGIPITISGRYVFRVTLLEEGADTSRVVAELPVEVTVNRVPQSDGT